MHLNEFSTTVAEAPYAVPAEHANVYDDIPIPAGASCTTAIYDDLKKPSAEQNEVVKLTSCVAYGSATHKKSVQQFNNN